MKKKPFTRPLQPVNENYPPPPAKKPDPTHSISKKELTFDDPAQIMILIRIIYQAATTPSPHFSPERMAGFTTFLEEVNQLENDMGLISDYFRQNFPNEFPTANTKEALIKALNEMTTAAKNNPTPEETESLARLFRAFATICKACNFSRALISSSKELDLAATLWQEKEIDVDSLISVTDMIKNQLSR